MTGIPGTGSTIALEHYDRLIERISTWACKEELGKETPKTQAQMAQVVRRVSQTMSRAEIFHVNPELHVRQSWFLKLQPRRLIACTGNKWGKTYALLLKALTATFGCAPWDPGNTHLFNPVKYEPPIEVVLSGPNYVTWVALNIVPRLKKLIPWDALVENVSRVQGQVIDGIKFFNGSSWKILSYVQDTPAYEGWSCHLKLWDEPMPQDKYVAASRGCIEFEAPQIMSYTPLSNPWVYDEFWDRGFKVDSPEAYLLALQGEDERLFDPQTGLQRPIVVSGAMTDNPHISAAAKKEFEREVLRGKPEEQAARLRGEHRALMGLCYPSFSEEKHVRTLEMIA